MEASHNKIIFLIFFLNVTCFSLYAQNDITYKHLKLKGNVKYIFEKEKDGYYIKDVIFENDSTCLPLLTNCLTGNSFLHSLGLINSYSYQTDIDTLFCLERTYAITKTPNKGGCVKIISPFYYCTTDSLIQINFKLEADFTFFQNLSNKYTNKFKGHNKVLVINNIINIEKSDQNYLIKNKLMKCYFNEVFFFPNE